VRRILYYIVGIAVVCYGWQHYRNAQRAALDESDPVSEPAVGQAAAASRYHCDGRVYCSQMHSCEEATWFLQNCPV